MSLLVLAVVLLVLTTLSETQGWQCFISGRFLPPHAISIERLDESIGYKDDNTRLIIRDFQCGTTPGQGDAGVVQGTGTAAQWTPQKFALVREIRQSKKSTPFLSTCGRELRSRRCVMSARGTRRTHYDSAWPTRSPMREAQPHSGTRMASARSCAR